MKKGFTITEAMIAIVMTTIVLAAAVPLLTSTTRKLYQSRDHYVATTICLAQLERVRDIPYSQLGQTLGGEVNVRVNATGAQDPDGRFRRTTSVAVDAPDAGVTTVTVAVDIMNRRTGQFDGERETMSYIYTEYLKMLE